MQIWGEESIDVNLKKKKNTPANLFLSSIASRFRDIAAITTHMTTSVIFYFGCIVKSKF